MSEETKTIQAIQYVITREFVQFGQLTLYHALYKAGEDGASSSELAEAIRGGDRISLRGVLGALGNRINQTKRFREKRPGIKLFFRVDRVKGKRHYWMRPETRAAIEGLPKLHEAVQWSLEEIIEKYREEWWANAETQREQLGLQAIRDQMDIKRNERELPFLDRALLNTIFDGVYEHNVEDIESESVRDFLRVLYMMQDYNCRYRPQACADLFPLFEETVGPMEPNSEGTTMWLALGLAIVELYGMRRSTLRGLLAQVTVRG